MRSAKKFAMSDNWIALIPRDPQFVPDEALQHLAADRLAAIAPEAEEIEIKVSDHVQFFDCGANLERITCPSCGQDVSVDWWQNRMDDDHNGSGFKLAGYSIPCCGASVRLDELRYDWPQGFARFGIDAMNPDISELSTEDIQEFETLLGTPLRAIYQHI